MLNGLASLCKRTCARVCSLAVSVNNVHVAAGMCASDVIFFPLAFVPFLPLLPTKSFHCVVSFGLTSHLVSTASVLFRSECRASRKRRALLAIGLVKKPLNVTHYKFGGNLKCRVLTLVSQKVL